MSAFCAKGPRFNPRPGMVCISILPNAGIAALLSANYVAVIS